VLRIATSHGSPLDISIPFLLEKHVGPQHDLSLDLAKFSPMLWLERVPEV
jgi:hypothetical protein